MNTFSVSTFQVRIYLSGPIEIIAQECRRFCLQIGLCVTVDPTRFIYTGGEEFGVVVGLINYPRFPSTPEDISEKAKALALLLLDTSCQHSILILGPQTTEWITKRDSV